MEENNWSIGAIYRVFGNFDWSLATYKSKIVNLKSKIEIVSYGITSYGLSAIRVAGVQRVTVTIT